MNKEKKILAGITLLVVFSISYVLFSIESPFNARGRQLDQTRVSHISSLKYAIDNYYASNRRLPQALNLISNSSYNVGISKDPETGKEYEYYQVTNTSYKICATFTTSSYDNVNSQGLISEFKHPKDYYCFNLRISDSILKQISSDYSGSYLQKLYGTGESKDNSRLIDLANLQTAINVTINQATVSGSILMCNGKNYPCSGSTLTGSNNPNGTGWVKINFGPKRSIALAVLPYDVVNDIKYHYVYCADKSGWEINGVFESSQYQSLMKNDGGDDYNKYEIGSNLNLIDKILQCVF